MSHTEGTWEITHRFDAEGYPYTIECDGRTIATIAPGGYATTADDPEGNAHILVAAPPMLAALKMLIAADMVPVDHDALKTVNRAIALAEGHESGSLVINAAWLDAIGDLT